MSITIEELVSAPPPSGAFPFIFTDESGIVRTSLTEPFFGIGLLKLSDAGRWNHELNRILDQAVSVQAKEEGRVGRGRHLEFKFKAITKTYLLQYKRLLDFFVTQPDAQFCAFVVDKTRPGIDPIAVCGTTWDALIKYTITLVKRYIQPGERAIIISDNYQKPKASYKFFEREIVQALGVGVANALMLESSSCVMIQLVDVLLGCVIYHYKQPSLLKIGGVDSEKLELADHLAKHYARDSLRGSFTRTAPNYFSVWEFRPAHPATETKN